MKTMSTVGRGGISEGSIAEEVIIAIADHEGSDPIDLSPPLYDVIDSDALDRLLQYPNVQVNFSYDGHAVLVRSDGEITVSD